MTQGDSPIPVLDSSFCFTEAQDWFSGNIENWERLFPLVSAKEPRILEIGSWEGRSAVFLANNLLSDGGNIVCIDHFDLFKTKEGKERFERINHNLGLTGKAFRVVPEFSFPAMMKLLEEEMSAKEAGYDWIYVDGSHRADDTLLDGELAWRLARKGAILIFDDYGWEEEPKESIHHPKRGIDAFLELHRGEYELLSAAPDGYQMVLRKTAEMRIGFLVPQAPDPISIPKAFDYGIKIVTATDSLYAMPASVALASVVKHTPGRISIYVVDCGMLSGDRDLLVEAIPKRENVTLMFVTPTEGSATAKWGPMWVKVDLHELLPIERVLYLDADILVRKDITALWNIDLGGKAIGAALDVGHPNGHDPAHQGPYFNSGVLLLDLGKVRRRALGLKETCEKRWDSKFRDQDALNEYFAGDWKSLSLCWNAQGLGTYATFYSPDRKVLDPEERHHKDPAIVHFTGPLHPSLPAVLNPFVQPYTAKPWGYAGSPGHPYAQEWWKAVDNTGWGPYLATKWKEDCELARGKALVAAETEFSLKTRGTARGVN